MAEAPGVAPVVPPMVALHLGVPVFAFTSFHDWLLHAQARFQSHGLTSRQTICVDTAGRPCGWGEHFRRAEEERTYPVQVYAPWQELASE